MMKPSLREADRRFKRRIDVREPRELTSPAGKQDAHVFALEALLRE